MTLEMSPSSEPAVGRSRSIRAANLATNDGADKDDIEVTFVGEARERKPSLSFRFRA